MNSENHLMENPKDAFFELPQNNNYNDKLLLGLTLIMNNNLRLKLSKFSPFMYYGNDNILHVNPLLSEIKPLRLQGRSYDSLYLTKKIIPTEIQILYITPHHIFTHEKNGQITTDLLIGSLKNNITPIFILNENNVNALVAYPTQRFRLIDGRSVEMFENMWKLSSPSQRGTNISSSSISSSSSSSSSSSNNGNIEENNNILGIRPILGLCDLSTNVKRLIYLTQFSDLINRIQQVFKVIKYFPYMIHPYRLLVSENGKFNVISFSLLQYMFSPHAETKKITDIVFSHPLSLIKNDTKFETNLNKIKIKIKTKENLIINSRDLETYHQYLTQSNCRLLLDMLHSLFVTTVWIANGGGVIHKQHTLVRNYLTLQGNMLLTPKKHNNPYRVTSRQPLHSPLHTSPPRPPPPPPPLLLPSSSPPASLPKPITTHSSLTSSVQPNTDSIFHEQLNCQNPYGLCHAQILYGSFTSEDIKHRMALHVHNYGCLHLLNYTPTVLQVAFTETLTSHQENILIETVDKEINIILAFITQVKKELEQHNESSTNL